MMIPFRKTKGADNEAHWTRLCEVANALQTTLKLPAPAVSISGGDALRPIDAPKGRIGVLICYDVEFPEAARYLADLGAEILFVPFCTDTRQSYLRVRYCAHARAIENQVYVALAGNDFKAMAAVLEKHMQQRQFVVGDGLTVADIVMAYTLDWAKEARLLDGFPQLVAYMERMYARPRAAPRIAQAFASLKA